MTIPDAQQRSRALDPQTSFIVQAPAGSGKTELLIQRYLTLLARVKQPESVVAITFTRKAAGEMRQRVVKALRDAAGPCPSQPHAALTWELARAVQVHSEALRWELLHNPSRLRVRTIDSLCAALARQMPWLSRLGGPPEIVEDASDLYADAARRTLDLLEGEEWAAEVRTLLAHLDNDVQKLQDLLEDMLARRDQWLRHVAGAADPLQSRAALEAALQSVIEEAVQAVRELLPLELGPELAAVSAAASAQRLARSGASPTALPAADNLAAWLDLVEMLLTKKHEWRKTLTVTQGFPSNGALKPRGMVLLEALSGNEPLRAALAALRCLPDPRFAEAQWQALRAALKLLPVAAAHLHVSFQERGKADYAEIAMAAQRALGAAGEPTELALSLDYQIQHLLVDEFQDTSVSQYALLERLVAGWQRGDGRTLFLVGDPMQSIYRFREAEVGLFLKASREGLGDVPLEPLQLSANFRSERSLVDWVNATFPEVLPPQQDLTTGAISFRRSVAVHEQLRQPAVTFHAFLGPSAASEAARVVEIVRTARDSGASKVAILVRARSHLGEVIPALRASGLGFRAVEIDALGGVPLIQDLSALTRALLHPADRIAWLALLRAPWCGLTLEDLHVLAGDDPRAALWDRISDSDRVKRLTLEGQQRLERVRAVLASAFANRRFSLRAWVEGAWLALGGPACATRAMDLEDAKAYFALLEEMEEGGTLDLASLQARIAQLHAQPDAAADESLQVMTIHKAKGLEFDVVIVPGLGRKAPHERARLLRWLERPRLGGRPDLLLAPIPAAVGRGDPTHDYLKHIDELKAEYEAARVLYVAATRAKAELHLLGHTEYGAESSTIELKPPQSSSLLRRMWAAAEPAFQEAAQRFTVPAPSTPPEAKRQPQLLQRLRSSWRLPAPPPPVLVRGPLASEESAGDNVSFRWVGETLRHVGTVVHQMLRRIAEDGLPQWEERRLAGQRPTYRAALAALGVPPSELPQAVERVATALARTLAGQRGRWLLSGEHQQAACEYPVCGVVGGRLVSGVIDRTFVDESGTRWIIDFKSSAHEGTELEAFLDNERDRYREQLLRYHRLFAGLERRPVRMALYFPLLDAWREIDEPALDHAAGREPVPA